MKILVINAGSSSFKYQLIDMTDESVIAKGLCERIGTAGNIKHKAADGRVYEAEYSMPTHMEAFDCLIYALTESEAKVIDSLDEISAVGHRVVQGGDFYSQSVVINEDVLKTVESFNDLAPLHNPANLMGVRACIKAFGEDVPRWPCSTPPSTKPCPKRPTYIPCRMNTTKSTVSAATVFTVPRTDS